MTIEFVRNEFGEIVDAGTAVERIASALMFSEGPVWDARGRRLIFSDIPGDCLYSWSESDGVTIFRRPSGQANGNTIDAEGRLLTCEHSNRRVSRTDAAGRVETIAAGYEGKRLNSPNDVVCAPNGDVYFTDPPYGLRRPDGTFGPQELPFNGVFRWSAATGDLTLLADDFVRPNGIVLSAGGRGLFVADTQMAHVRVFDLGPGAGLPNGRVFAETKHEGVTARPDGMKMDVRGNLYVASSTESGVWVYGPDGRLLGQIGVGETPANIAFGGDGWQTLFVTAQTSVYRLRLKVAGQPVGPR